MKIWEGTNACNRKPHFIYPLAGGGEVCNCGGSPLKLLNLGTWPAVLDLHVVIGYVQTLVDDEIT